VSHRRRYQVRPRFVAVTKPVTLTELCRSSGLTEDEITASLIELVEKGLVTPLEGDRYILHDPRRCQG
jgi:hypothetical protein